MGTRIIRPIKFIKQMHRNYIFRLIKDDEERKKIQEIRETEKQLYKFRLLLDTVLVESMNKFVKKTDHVLGKETKLKVFTL